MTLKKKVFSSTGVQKGGVGCGMQANISIERQVWEGGHLNQVIGSGFYQTSACYESETGAGRFKCEHKHLKLQLEQTGYK